MKKNIIIIVTLFFCIIVLFFIILHISINISNNNISKNIEKELKALPLPNNTELVDSIAVSGKLTGNGNGMQYLGAIFIKTELSQEDLENYYKNYRKNKWYCLIKKQNTEKIDIIEHGNYTFRNFNNDEAEKYYIIYSWGISNNEILQSDIRGH